MDSIDGEMVLSGALFAIAGVCLAIAWIFDRRRAKAVAMQYRLGIRNRTGAPTIADFDRWQVQIQAEIEWLLSLTGFTALGRPYAMKLMRAGWEGPAAGGYYLATKLLVVFAAVGVHVNLTWDSADDPGKRIVQSFLVGLLIWVAVDVALNIRISRRRMTMQQTIPLWLDLHATLIEGGLGFDAALEKITSESRLSTNPMYYELRRLYSELSMGSNRQLAYRRMVERTEIEELDFVMAAFRHGERVGAGVLIMLQSQADMLRNRVWEMMCAKAMRLPVKLIFPIIFGMLPMMFVVIIAPGMLRIYTLLRAKTPSLEHQIDPGIDRDHSRLGPVPRAGGSPPAESTACYNDRSSASWIGRVLRDPHRDSQPETP